MLIKKHIEVEVGAGADIYECIRSAIILSVKENVSVGFEFNETPIVVYTKDIVEKIHAQWRQDIEKA